VSGEVDPAAAIGRVAAPTPGPRAARTREVVVAALEACPAAHAAWEGGSAAFGRADLASDLDIGVLCTAGGGTSVLDSIERELWRVEPELVAWDVGASAFGVQRFWRPADEAAATTCMLDVSVLELEGDRDSWVELLSPERHGRALSTWDPEGVLESCRAQAGLDLTSHRAAIAAELERIRGRRAMFADFPAKELARGRVLDARAMYDSMVVTPLVTLLGMRFRPLRFSFGRRYLHDELPADVAARLVALVHAPADGDLDQLVADGLAWIDELLDGLDPAAIPLAEHAASMRAAFG
jgi:predicted nucleotidyltransferase